ncbi:expressed unknown protein [Ectocarpus siliculosus]|uniref:Uncharacterized protein n=1 Tax=Ectocarpus siliculosus TaxID=2880 RepID=D7FYC5_ECTSI|nr:expressed unknown protein [Ectocarpus siliculosus]|eukprot:CBJ32467.1 expressed unknown protein [Ectocarpus siliculosus]
MRRSHLVVGGLVLLSGVASAEVTRPNEFKKWRFENPPQMVVLGDSNSDTGRRFNTPASFQFEDEGIGPFPWKRVYDGPDSDEKTAAYMPFEGSVTNGKVWPTWLRIPDEHNFATSSATATDAFRSRERCTGYTGEGEDFPTATLEEQIDRYFYEIVDDTSTTTNDTLDYTHVIFIGINELIMAAAAVTRYSIGGEGYQDPVAFDKVFEVNATTGLPVLDENGLPVPTFTPMIEEVLGAWDEGIARLIGAGVTGRILLANVGSLKGLDGIAGTETATVLDQITLVLRSGAELLVDKYAGQVRMLDMYTLFAALVDDESIFLDLGFTPGEGSLLAETCIQFNFVVDDAAEIMGTQALRNPDCQEECALCADSTTPCATCLVDQPAVTKCDDPSTKIFYDSIHFTTDFHLVLGEAIRQCSKDSPNFDRAFVGVLCPEEQWYGA